MTQRTIPIILAAMVTALAIPTLFAAEPQLKTTGPVAEGPMQIGCWRPLADDLPPWIFPTTDLVWPKFHIKTMTVEDYGKEIVRQIKAMPEDQPVWFFGHGWFGGYKPGWDKGNVLAHVLDATAQGTPGIWPEKGLALWRDRQLQLMLMLRNAGCRLDMVVLDHETGIHEWAHNFSPEWTFRNIVLDPRWKEKPLLGTGLRGAQLLDPEVVRNADDIWVRKYFDNRKDIRIAHDTIRMLGRFIPPAALDYAMTEPTLEVFPDCTVNAYRKYPIPVLRNPDDLEDDEKKRWEAFFELRPQLRTVPGVGNSASPPFYAQKFYLKWYPDAKDRVEAMLMEADRIVEHYDGDADKLIPWMTLPSFHDRWTKKRAMTPEEYERLWTGLARRGVRRYILWFGKRHNTPEVRKEFMAAVRKAYAIARQKHR